MMREGGRRQQHGGYAGKAKRFADHCPLHDVTITNNSTNLGGQKCRRSYAGAGMRSPERTSGVPMPPQRNAEAVGMEVSSSTAPLNDRFSPEQTLASRMAATLHLLPSSSRGSPHVT